MKKGPTEFVLIWKINKEPFIVHYTYDKSLPHQKDYSLRGWIHHCIIYGKRHGNKYLDYVSPIDLKFLYEQEKYDDEHILEYKGYYCKNNTQTNL